MLGKQLSLSGLLDARGVETRNSMDPSGHFNNVSSYALPSNNFLLNSIRSGRRDFKKCLSEHIAAKSFSSLPSAF